MAFIVHRDGMKVTAKPVSLTNFQDHGAPANAGYTVRPVVNGAKSNPVYREAVVWQDTAYNQPPHPSFASP